MKSSFLPIRHLLFPLTILIITQLSTAKEPRLINQLSQWRGQQLGSHQGGELTPGFNTIMACLLCFIAASLSSAGGVGGGALYIPILNLVAGLDVKTATKFSAFMVTGGSVSNVLYTLFFQSQSRNGGKPLIDYEIALFSQPCMLLGVSVGVLGNVMFPEWLITLLFAVFLACSTYKTCSAGCKCWKAESEVRSGFSGMEERLLERGGEGADLGVPWRKLLVLVLVWVSFFVLHLLIADKDGKGIIRIRPCGSGFWLITLSQVPLAVGFTAYFMCSNCKEQQLEFDQERDGKDPVVHDRIKNLPMLVFPIAALLSGVLGGLFGIGGGLLINPVLLQIGVAPQVTAATTSFMVLFSSSMSLVQYLILGMKAVKQAMVFTGFCFVASVVGLVIIQRAIGKSGRASLIVFSVSVVMALSTVSITSFGAIDVWREYQSGKNMGFNPPC